MVYISITTLGITSYIQGIIFGGEEGIAKHYYLVFGWPIIISVPRLILMLLMFYGLETPLFYFAKGLDEDTIRSKLSAIYSTVYADDDVPEVVDFKIETVNASNLEDSIAISDLFKKRHRFRFSVCVWLNIAQQLSGVNFLNLYSTTFFNEVSGNG